ncbi:glucosyltransferase domain-containing protein [Eisenbergiella sp.]
MKKPIDVIKECKLKIKSEIKFTFIFTFFIGLFTHLYMLTNKLPNHDDIRTFFGFGVSGQLGRWGLAQLGNIVTGMDLSYSIPMINGTITIVLISLTACILVDLFSINDKLLCAIVGGCLITFPALTCTFFFMFTVGYYALSVLLSVLSVYIFVKCKNINIGVKIVLSAILLIGSVSIYQAYFPFAASLYIILLLSGCMEKKNMLPTAFLYGTELIIALLGYLGLTKFYCIYTGTELSNFHGISNMGNSDIGRIFETIKIVFQRFWMLFSDGLEINYNWFCRIIFLVFILVSTFILGMKVLELFREGKIFILVQCVIFYILFPVGTLGIYIMCPKTDDVYSIMLYPVVMFIVCAVVFVNKMDNGLIAIICNWVISISAVCLIIFYFLFANIQYMSIEMGLHQAESYFTTMITQIKSVEGYRNGMNVIFIGEKISDESFYGNDLMASYNVTGREQNFLNVYCRDYFMRDYLGFQSNFMQADDMNRDMLDEMNCYPNDGSIKVIKGQVYVKLE